MQRRKAQQNEFCSTFLPFISDSSRFQPIIAHAAGTGKSCIVSQSGRDDVIRKISVKDWRVDVAVHLVLYPFPDHREEGFLVHDAAPRMMISGEQRSAICDTPCER